MISDVLSKAINEINRYLAAEETADCYQGTTRQDIENLLMAMNAVRALLDTPPHRE